MYGRRKKLIHCSAQYYPFILVINDWDVFLNFYQLKLVYNPDRLKQFWTRGINLRKNLVLWNLRKKSFSRGGKNAKNRKSKNVLKSNSKWKNCIEVIFKNETNMWKTIRKNILKSTTKNTKKVLKSVENIFK